jgi:sugar/nucleoside kinase (ribokinase family)
VCLGWRSAVRESARLFAGATDHPMPPHTPATPSCPPRLRSCVPLLQWLDYITPNAEELLAIAVAAGHGRAASCDKSAGAGKAVGHRGGMAASGNGSGGRGDGADRLLARLAPGAAAVLSAGAGCILLTLGEAGAALLTLEGAQRRRGCGGGRGRASGAGVAGLADMQLPGGGGGRVAVVARHVPAALARVVSVSGAGDCLAAGFAAALARGAPEERALAEGTLAARAAVETAANVPPSATLRAAVRDAAAVEAQLRSLRVLRLPLGGAL